MNAWELPDSVMVSALRDPVVEPIGYAPDSSEVTRLWTPLLGPAAVALYRSLASVTPSDPGTPPSSVATGAVARSLGLSQRKARIVLSKAIHRLDYFDFVSAALPDVAVRLVAPPLPRRLVSRVPAPWRGLIATGTPGGTWSAGSPRPGAAPPPARVTATTPSGPAPAEAPPRPVPPDRAPRLLLTEAEIPASLRRSALSLLRQGVAPALAVRQLARWGDNATLAAAAVDWAATLPEVRGPGTGRHSASTDEAGPRARALPAAQRAARARTTDGRP